MNRELQKNNPKLYDQYFEEIPRIFKSISSNFLVSATDMDIVEIDEKHFLQLVSSFYSPKYVDPLRTNKDPVTISESCTLVAELDENKKLTGSGVVISADSHGNLPTAIIVEHYNDGKAYYHSVSSADKTTFYNVADRSQISQALSIQRTWKDKNHFFQSILDNIDKYINPNQNDALAAKAYAAGKDFGKKEYSPEFVQEWQARQKQIKEETAQLEQDKDVSTRLAKIRKQATHGVDKITEVTGMQKAAETVFHKDIRTEKVKVGNGIKKFEQDIDKIIDKVISTRKTKE